MIKHMEEQVPIMAVLTIIVSEVALTVSERRLSETMLQRDQGTILPKEEVPKRMSLVCD